MLVIEPLAEAIQCDPPICGLVVPQSSHKIVLYTDDVLLFMSNPAVSVNCLMHSMPLGDQFQVHSFPFPSPFMVPHRICLFGNIRYAGKSR